jgi:hypothetical protein
LAAAEKVVRLTTDWQISTSNWLLDVPRIENRLTTESNCIFGHPAEQQLIQTLMAVLNVIYSDNRQLTSSRTESIAEGRSLTNGHRKSPNWTKLTLDLAQSWLEFYRHCQIFGNLKHQNPRQDIARCGLTAISRRYLQVLLENYLGVNAAEEL